MKSRTCCREKLERSHGLPKVVKIPQKMRKRLGRGKMVVPAPLTVDAVIRAVRKGNLVTVRGIRERIARNFKADVACPLTTGIFVRISAEAAEEDLKNGKEHVTPYWRVIGEDGSLNDKFPGGCESHGRHLIAEKHIIIRVPGKKSTLVKNFQKRLHKF